MCCFVPFAVLLNVLQGDVDNDSACRLHSRQELNVGQNGTHLPDTLVSIYTYSVWAVSRPLSTLLSTLEESIISRTDDTHVVDPQDSCCGRQGAVISIRMVFWSQ